MVARRAVAAYRRRRFAWLFVALLLTLAGSSSINALGTLRNPVQLLLGLTLFAAIASAEDEREARPLVLLGVAFVAAQGLRLALGIPALLRVSEGLWVFGAVLATVAAVRHALRPGVVDGERVLAALDAYLLAGLLFGVGYWTLDGIWPGSFAGAGSGPLDLARAMYFSFVTIATLGYGDVVPASEPARGLAILEAVSGQMYLAVLVARLVSLYSREDR